MYLNPQSRRLRGLSAQVEFHYTTTLNDAKTDTGRLVEFLGQHVDLEIGNLANRVDVANIVLGVNAVVGQTMFTHGFTIPVSTGSDKAFDFEYSFLVNRRF